MTYAFITAAGLIALIFLVVHNGPVVCSETFTNGPGCHVEWTLSPK
jgi:hypothetical protein